ncbi:MAG: SDR family NAD(P)-dependent oxidoreductase, partial [Brevundimonas sp.]|nr:SDR family NAD(P)-dependent oxidoreductase [Brevundimonas sp.]
MSEAVAVPSLLVFGGGWLGQAAGREAVRRGGRAVLTSREAGRRAALSAEGLPAIDPDDAAALAGAVAAASAILICAPPGPDGCPGLKALSAALSAAGTWPDWIGYISSTAG